MRLTNHYLQEIRTLVNQINLNLDGAQKVFSNENTYNEYIESYLDSIENRLVGIKKITDILQDEYINN